MPRSEVPRWWWFQQTPPWWEQHPRPVHRAGDPSQQWAPVFCGCAAGAAFQVGGVGGTGASGGGGGRCGVACGRAGRSVAGCGAGFATTGDGNASATAVSVGVGEQARIILPKITQPRIKPQPTFRNCARACLRRHEERLWPSPPHKEQAIAGHYEAPVARSTRENRRVTDLL